MSLRRRLKSRAGEKHCNASSKTHAAHVYARKQSRYTAWIPASIPSIADEAAAEFGLDYESLGLPRGECFWEVDGSLRLLSGEDFERQLASARDEFGWFWQSRKLKSGRDSRTRRKRPHPVQEVTVSLSPAQSLFLRDMNAADIASKLYGLLPRLAEDLTDQTGWKLLGASIHYDSSRPHFNFYITRVGDDHYLHGRQRLGTLGPWAVGEWRLAKLGAGTYAGNRILQENLANFALRHGPSAEPLDLRLHRLLDDSFKRDLNKNEMGRFEKCEAKHAKWKKAQIAKILREWIGRERVAWQLLSLCGPHLRPYARAAIQGVEVMAKVMDILKNLPAEESSNSCPKQNQPQLK
ncbi:MAG: hypothetical protein FGM15_04795 [Chthoniobacterales bacterium]|nr:hypothetical protein [Chthoniobacterales bacterium]